MKSRVFVDSNIILYLYDDKFPNRQKAAKKLLTEGGPEIVISTPVVKETCSVLLKKFQFSISSILIVLQILEKFEIVDTPLPVVESGLQLMSTHSISFWDSLIVAAAHSARCQTIYTEDLSHGQKLLDMKIHNPFA